jgi:hypothetical protein
MYRTHSTTSSQNQPVHAQKLRALPVPQVQALSALVALFSPLAVENETIDSLLHIQALRALVALFSPLATEHGITELIYFFQQPGGPRSGRALVALFSPWRRKMKL